MAYEPTNWQSGDIVTSQKLNKLEQGIAENALTVSVPWVVQASSPIGQLDKTWQEIHDASMLSFVAVMKPAGAPPEFEGRGFFYIEVMFFIPGQGYSITLFDAGSNRYNAIASSPNDYPAFSQG